MTLGSPWMVFKVKNNNWQIMLTPVSVVLSIFWNQLYEYSLNVDKLKQTIHYTPTHWPSNYRVWNGVPWLWLKIQEIRLSALHLHLMRLMEEVLVYFYSCCFRRTFNVEHMIRSKYFKVIFVFNGRGRERKGRWIININLHTLFTKHQTN